MNKTAWMIFSNNYDEDTQGAMIVLDKTDALEMYMSFVEEDVYERFYHYCMAGNYYEREFPNIHLYINWLAKAINLYDTDYYVAEVPCV